MMLNTHVVNMETNSQKTNASIAGHRIKRDCSLSLDCTVLLSGQVEARKPSSSVKRVGRISRSVRGVFDTTIFHTWRDACLTTSCMSERPM